MSEVESAVPEGKVGKIEIVISEGTINYKSDFDPAEMIFWLEWVKHHALGELK